MVATPLQSVSDELGGAHAFPSLAAQGDHRAPSNSSDPSTNEPDNVPCQSPLPDPAVLAAFLAYGETLRRLVDRGMV